MMTAVSPATTTTDLYPTRSGESTEVLPRTGPIVFGSPDDGPLTATELKHYEDTGYLTIDQLVSPEELALFTEELHRLSQDPAATAVKAAVCEAKSDEVRSIFNIHRTNEIFKKLANHPRLVDRARQILGSDVYIHQSRINYKPGFVGKEYSWHSDFETWHAEDGMPAPRAVSLSLSLTDNYSFNGPLMIMPGSHKRYISC